MAYKEVIEHYLTYRDRPVVWVRVQGEKIVHMIVPDPSSAVFVTDMLRNEKPVYYDPVEKTLSTSAEEVGEEET